MSFTITRRNLVRNGLAGAALFGTAASLSLRRRAAAQGTTPPKRYVLMYAGISIGKDGAERNELVPDNAGLGYDLKRSLLPLGSGALPYGGNGYDVQDDVSIVSGLLVPWVEGGGSVPPGGRSAPFHYNTLGPVVSGVRGGVDRTGRPQGPTSDQFVANAIAGDTPHRILNYRIQAASYVGGNGGGGDSGRISWDENGQGIDPISSPRLAHESLFTGFLPPDDSGNQAAALLLRRRQSALDIARSRSESLMGRLTASDRQTMQRHLDALRDFEARLDGTMPPTMGTCELLPSPGDDPPIGQPYENDAGYMAGYSNEALRAEVLTDLVHMAFVCDVSRVAAIRITNDQCFMNMEALVGAASDAHELSHGRGTDANMADSVAWHVSVFARLVAKLRDTQEIDGSSMLDNTALVLVFEGGHGYDPEAGSQRSAHSTENMAALIAGRVGGLAPGQHVVASGEHPVNVIVSAMQAVGAGDTLGEISGVIPELFS